MNVLSRLLRIVRAYWTVRDFDAAWQEPPGSGHGDHRQSRRQTAPGSQAASPRTIDPELAGYYANLEVPYGADLETVRRARNRLMQKYHPDLHSGDPEKQRIATELVKGLNLAYEKLEARLRKRS